MRPSSSAFPLLEMRVEGENIILLTEFGLGLHSYMERDFNYLKFAIYINFIFRII